MYSTYRMGFLRLHVILLGTLDTVGLWPLHHGILGPFTPFVPRRQLAVIPRNKGRN